MTLCHRFLLLVGYPTAKLAGIYGAVDLKPVRIDCQSKFDETRNRLDHNSSIDSPEIKIFGDCSPFL